MLSLVVTIWDPIALPLVVTVRDPITLPLVVAIRDPIALPLDLIHMGLRGSVSENHATMTVSGEEMSLQAAQARGKQAQVHRGEQR